MEGAFHEIMTGAFDYLELSVGGDKAERGGEFGGRAEFVFGAGDEERWCLELWKVGGAELGWFLRRMQRIREQEKAGS